MRAPAALLAALLVYAEAGAQAPASPDAGPAGEIFQAMNRMRAPGGACATQATPLVFVPALAQVAAQLGRSVELGEALRGAGYRATEAQTIAVSGASGGRLAEILAQRFCAQIGKPGLLEAGVHVTPGGLWIVLAAPFAPKVEASREQVIEQTLALVNAARAEARRCGEQAFPAARPVRWNEVLERAARLHAEDMAAHSYFSHTGLDGSTPAQRVARAGYRFRATGENIASGQISPAEAVAGWIKSPPHCANLMSPAYTEMGVAHAANPQSRMGVYWAQLFGTPLPAR